ncbi:MAG TPA: hypothetical protein VJY40_07050, partial [Corynebacterium sp.]|nr:hypothetical protein [Corynebacterium sp.]
MPARSTTTYGRVGVSDIRSAVSRVREKNFTSGVIALHDPVGWDGPAALELDGARVAVIDTPTPLAMRNAVSFPVDDIDFTVLVTPLLDADLPEDVLAHLTPFHRVNIPVPADALRELFAANVLRPNIIRNRRDIAGVVDYLARRDGHPADLTPASAGVLTANHLHHQLLTVGAGLPTPLTVSAVIAWSLDPRSVQTWQDFVDSVSGEVLDRALDWLRIRLGESSGAVVRYLRAHGPRDLATWGLVAEVIAPGPGVDNSARASAEGAFRMSTGIGAVSTAELATWSNAVHAAFDPATRPAGMSDDLLKAAAKEAEQLIISPTGLDAADLLHRSRVCHGALDARIARLTDALDTWYADPAEGTVAEAWAAVRAHIGGQHDHPDVVVAAAVIRMIQWLRSAEKSSPTTLSGWLQHYRRELSWVDVCINRAWRDHSTTEL